MSEQIPNMSQDEVDNNFAQIFAGQGLEVVDDTSKDDGLGASIFTDKLIENGYSQDDILTMLGFESEDSDEV